MRRMSGLLRSSLVKRLTPVVQRRVAATLLRMSGGARDLRPEIEDLTQEVLLSLFAREGKILEQWQPEYGLSLENFVGMVARRRALSVLRSRRSSPFTQQATDPADLDERPDAEHAADALHSSETRQSLEQLALRLQERLSPLGLQMFQLLFVAEDTVPEVAKKTGLSGDSIYQWRTRIKKLALELQSELAPDSSRGYQSVAND